jgi:Tol biopolymer transport system component
VTTTGGFIGPYRIIGPLGSGGMGEVFRAHDTKLGRDVAIKLLPAAAAQDTAARARFEREARMLAALHHPHIATIFGVEDAGGTPALVMELVDGQTLDERISGGPLPASQVIRIARQIVDALDAAHEKGIVHRDLKPSNIKLTSDETVKVLDFGLAIARPAALATGDTITVQALTEAGTIAGTPRYMSPEQVRGEDVDKRSDIWAFGCVLFEMLTGHPVFSGRTVSDVIANVLHQDPDVRALPAATPPGLVRLLHRCLDKDRRRRLRDIGDVAAELDNAPGVAPLSARTRAASVVPWVLLVVAIGAAAVLLMKRDGSRGSLPDLRVIPVTTDAGYTAEPALSPDGRLLAYTSDRAGGANRDIWVQQLQGGSPLRLTDDPADDSRPDFSPDGSQIAFRSERNGGGVYLVPALGGTPRLLAKGGRSPKFSPDGTRVAYWTGQFRGNLREINSEAYVVSLSGGEPVRLMGGFAVANSPIWSPDSQSLLVLAERNKTGSSGGADWWLAPAAGGEPHPTGLMDWMGRYDAIRAGLPDAALLVWTPRGILIPRHTGLWMVPVSPAARMIGEPQQLTLSTSFFTAAAVSRDGEIVFSAIAVARNIERLPLDHPASVPEVLYSDSNSDEWRASTSRDGSTIVFERMNGARHEIWVKDTNTGAQRLLAPVDVAGQVNATVSPDGTRVTYVLPQRGENPSTQGTTSIIDVAGGVPRKLCEQCAAWGFLSDSRRVILTDRARAIQFRGSDAATDIIAVPPGRGVDRPSVAPDERAIAFRIGEGAASKVYVAPLSGSTPVPEHLWTRIDEPTSTGRPCGWSPDSSTLYLLLDADGFRDLWGQKVSAGRPVGTPFVVRHLHQTTGVSTSLGNAVTAKGFLYEAGKMTGNIWRLTPAAAAK